MVTPQDPGDQERAQLIAALNQARRAIEEIGTRLGIQPRWAGLKTAAHEFGWHPETMARRAKCFGLGRLVGGSWVVDLNRVSAWLEGKHFEPIPQDFPAILERSGNKSDARAHGTEGE